ncbi:hypothetical protein OIU79_015554 [Salix purpurea]|uniref:Uncharacterized protein n=1 Tax=Salix purpurea TaxID=77065 RepID=A0A9Q0PCI6_SALPP|nr:hypothetical protein OIU79_015554 [Salix purpurea]
MGDFLRFKVQCASQEKRGISQKNGGLFGTPTFLPNKPKKPVGVPVAVVSSVHSSTVPIHDREQHQIEALIELDMPQLMSDNDSARVGDYSQVRFLIFVLEWKVYCTSS